MRLLLFLAFLVVPVLEIWLLIQVGSVIGGWPTVALLIADSLLGAWLVRREGRRAWRALREALESGRMPDRELADGGLILVGGALLLTPGFFTDIAGFLCVLPFTRPLMRRLGTWFFDRRVKRMAAASPYAQLFPQSFPGAPDAGTGGPGGGGKVVHGEVLREDREA
ncbi:FxsA family protein [Nonomuraea rhodomycinica]|uniref:FxsA family protein n=1 Tax=Nonomuraea rhodomycinica TaxID=1712872 RepID=A0A7Y6MB17_9ACTN|nr:FxsA family protein [Nonomuraea rhodomycinica]NUW41808.1 FxsA family protein [Nonomuraea rhodomycinica]